MAWLQTARKSTGGKAPRKLIASTNKSSLVQFLTGRQQAAFADNAKSATEKISYINYENLLSC